MEICYICGNSEDMCESKIQERLVVADIPLAICCECSMELELIVIPTIENLNYCIAKERMWFLRECRGITNDAEVSNHLKMMEGATRYWMETRITQTNMVMKIVKKLKSEKHSL